MAGSYDHAAVAHAGHVNDREQLAKGRPVGPLTSIWELVVLVLFTTCSRYGRIRSRGGRERELERESWRGERETDEVGPVVEMEKLYIFRLALSHLIHCTEGGAHFEPACLARHNQTVSYGT